MHLMYETSKFIYVLQLLQNILIKFHNRLKKVNLMCFKIIKDNKINKSLNFIKKYKKWY